MVFPVSTTFLIVIGSLSTFVNCRSYSPWDVVGCGRVSRPNVNSAVNEHDADAAHHPWMALLVEEGGDEHCPAILLPSFRRNTSYFAVLSLSCYRKINSTKKQLVIGIGPDGRLDGTYTRTVDVLGLFHTKRSPFEDLAFAYFDPEVSFNEHVKPVCLPRQSTPPRNSPCLLAGYSIERAEDGSHGISKVQLKETALMAHPMSMGNANGTTFFKIHNITSKTEVTHYKGTPLVCLHDGLWTLYGIILPFQSEEHEFTFKDVYNKLYQIDKEIDVPHGPLYKLLHNFLECAIKASASWKHVLIWAGML
uniref:Peptidase S1 domain-containing protein n=1 Tax=Trichuris muris TaxID=70415 RepID=A0A5S6R307_TRIMR